MTKGPWTSGSDAIGAALTLAVSVALFGFLGHRLDLVFDSSPLVLLILTALGAFGGFLHVLRVLAPDVHLFGSRTEGRPGSPAGPTEPADSGAGTPANAVTGNRSNSGDDDSVQQADGSVRRPSDENN